MSVEKKGRIIKSVFSNEWTNPSGGTTYYYDIEFDNKDKGAVGSTTKDSDRVMVGQNVLYKINGTKIKILELTNQPTKPAGKSYSPRKTSQESMLGYAWSYAKDLHVAGKDMKDIEELNKMARYIYEQIGEMLNNE
jgi:hypothetical protein